MAREQRQRLKTTESELADVRRRLDRLYHLLETTELDSADELTAMYALTGSYRLAAASATQEQVRSRILPTFRSVVSSFEGADGLIPNPLHITVFESRNPRRR